MKSLKINIAHLSNYLSKKKIQGSEGKRHTADNVIGGTERKTLGVS